jgi:hypothetical protein
MNHIHKSKKLYIATKHPLPDSLILTNMREALKSHHWRHAMSEEFNALVKHGIWELISPSPHIHPIGCKWVFKIKRHPNGSIATYKVRLVAKGFHQTIWD